MTDLTVTLRVIPDLSDDGFLRKCYREWEQDAAWYRAHPEEDCPPDYLEIPPFEEYVAQIATDRVEEIVSMCGQVKYGFKIERADDPREAIRAYIVAIGRAPNNRDETEIKAASEALVAAAK